MSLKCSEINSIYIVSKKCRYSAVILSLYCDWEGSMNLSDELKKLSLEKQDQHGRHAFLVVKEEVRQALSEGFTVIEVWRNLNAKGKTPVQYRQFARYVRRFITQPKTKKQAAQGPSCSDTVKGESRGAQAASTPSSTSLTGRFEYDPMGKPWSELV